MDPSSGRRGGVCDCAAALGLHVRGCSGDGVRGAEEELMRSRYHRMMELFWLWLFDHAPTQRLELYCIERASAHTYWDGRG